MRQRNDDRRLRGEFIEFIRQNRAKMERVARSELRAKGCADPEGHAEDIADEVILSLWLMWATLRSPEGSIYVFTVNRARTHARSCRREFAAEIQDYQVPMYAQPGRDPDKMIEEIEFIDMTRSILSEDEFLVFQLRFLHDMAFASIAERLQKPLGTVTSTYSRSLDKLKEALKAMAASPAVITPGTSA